MEDQKAGPEFKARMSDGTKLMIYPCKPHWVAYNAAGVRVGEPFIEMANLLKNLGAELLPGQEKELAKIATEAAAPAVRKMEVVGAAKGQDGALLVLKYDAFHVRAFNKAGEMVGDPFILEPSLLAAIGAVKLTDAEADALAEAQDKEPQDPEDKGAVGQAGIEHMTAGQEGAPGEPEHVE